jgi:hypothetical protein
VKPVRSTVYTSGDVDPRTQRAPDDRDLTPEQHFLMDRDPRLSRMPARPTLVDFFRHRFTAPQHSLQSARLARRSGAGETVVIACLLHDVAIHGFIRGDHGYWGAQLVEPYVDEEVAWAIRAHQVLRFYPDPDAGYAYPDAYVRFFGDAYEPPEYVSRAYERARRHRWYGTARAITVNDIYAFDPDVAVDVEEFADLIARRFRQPPEGLGFDDSPSAHMWRTINMPTRFL